jgi:hypothetical protein
MKKWFLKCHLSVCIVDLYGCAHHKPLKSLPNFADIQCLRAMIGQCLVYMNIFAPKIGALGRGFKKQNG